MQLNRNVFRLDAAACVERLCHFVRNKREELRRESIVVPLSGGLDSSTVLLLCARAVGKERVRALLMPENGRTPDAQAFARMLTDRFDIGTIVRDIAPTLDAIGVDRANDDRWARHLDSDRRQDIARMRRMSFVTKLRSGGIGSARRQFARINTRHRVRSVVACLVAEERNALLVGCAHKSEGMLGLFVRFGVDDNADIMPLRDFYRSEILQIAEHLDVPREIIERAPNPEIVPGVVDKYRDILEFDAETVDLIVWGIEHGLVDEEIALQLRIPAEEVGEIREVIALTEHMRHPAASLNRR